MYSRKVTSRKAAASHTLDLPPNLSSLSRQEIRGSPTSLLLTILRSAASRRNQDLKAMNSLRQVHRNWKKLSEKHEKEKPGFPDR